ncbi:transcription factor TFIIF complex subunit Tfg3, partial [Spiromyces aspiralis]
MSSSVIKQAPKTTISIITEHSPDPYHDIDEHTGYPLRCWSVSLRDARPGFEAVGTTLPYVRKVIFDLHETFDNPHRCISRPPFLVREKGWGEFTMKITIVWMDDALEPEVITHDLSFQNNGRYIMQKIVTFDRQRPSKMFMDLLNSRPSISSKTVPPPSRSATAGKANRTRKSLPRKAPPCPAPSSHPIHSRYSPDDVFDTDGEELSDIIGESDSESSMPLNYSTG